MGRRKTWTIENEAYLSENYGIIPILDIAEKLETTELAVEAHARVIGLLTKRSKKEDKSFELGSKVMFKRNGAWERGTVLVFIPDGVKVRPSNGKKLDSYVTGFKNVRKA
ncbi:hypothetical protein [Carnobacterium divergens]|uniref:hypothetical protein n=1 Tax=Carnobacterium divergens TaxID=2748 RepID=UPI0010723C06|nr:hypothetical protein [Carnobacterium divergens]MPQ22189.1 hypothetical protein [Carnobacterium divergens]TFI75528.1 hypothetical protein CKN81_01445 [Carnobacterium divergens]